MQQIVQRGQAPQRGVILDNQSSSSLDKLVENIGLEESKSLLIKALPIISGRKADILKALNNNDISLASKYAHQASGSVRLYGSSRLEALLQEVMLSHPDQAVSGKLAAELGSEFDAAISEIRKRLD